MANFALRYDLRCPPFSKTDHQEQYRAALDQCEWADKLGFVSVTLSEHHGSPDGYLPSPLVFGAAVAERTRNMRLTLAALISPLHDPLRLAEDVAVLDVLSGGRVIPIFSGGYVESEFEAFGKKLSDRARLMDAIVPFMQQAWTGEPFEHEGRTVRCTPRPVQSPRPPILLGGASAPAARRAARLADGFMPTVPAVHDYYREECVKLGKPDPGPMTPTLGSFLHVTRDPDADWERLAPYAMHEMNAYGQWAAESGSTTGYRPISDPDELRATGMYPVMTPEQVIEKARELGPEVGILLHPLMGGTDPELAWESLRLVEAEVLPALRDHP